MDKTKIKITIEIDDKLFSSVVYKHDTFKLTVKCLLEILKFNTNTLKHHLFYKLGWKPHERLKEMDYRIDEIIGVEK